MLCSGFCLCSPCEFVFGFVKVANNIAQFCIYQKYALFRDGVSQFKVGYFAMWLPVFKFGGIPGFHCLFSVLIFGYIKVSAMCHLNGVPTVVKLVAFCVYNKLLKGKWHLHFISRHCFAILWRYITLRHHSL